MCPRLLDSNGQYEINTLSLNKTRQRQVLAYVFALAMQNCYLLPFVYVCVCVSVWLSVCLCVCVAGVLVLTCSGQVQPSALGTDQQDPCAKRFVSSRWERHWGTYGWMAEIFFLLHKIYSASKVLTLWERTCAKVTAAWKCLGKVFMVLIQELKLLEKTVRQDLFFHLTSVTLKTRRS